MLVASVSDIHLDYKANRELFVKMAAAIGARRPDAVLVVGDVCHIDALIASAIRVLTREVEHVAYVPGNHDLWVDRPWEELLGDPDFDTWKRHDQVLKRLVESEGGQASKPIRPEIDVSRLRGQPYLRPPLARLNGRPQGYW